MCKVHLCPLSFSERAKHYTHRHPACSSYFGSKLNVLFNFIFPAPDTQHTAAGPTDRLAVFLLSLSGRLTERKHNTRFATDTGKPARAKAVKRRSSNRGAARIRAVSNCCATHTMTVRNRPKGLQGCKVERKRETESRRKRERTEQNWIINSGAALTNCKCVIIFFFRQWKRETSTETAEMRQLKTILDFICCHRSHFDEPRKIYESFFFFKYMICCLLII